jgi:hypothetical protein
LGCHSRLVRKEVENDDITVQWFFYSTITDISPDYVVVKKKHSWEEIEVYDAYDVVTDIQIEGKKVIVKLCGPCISLYEYSSSIHNDSIKEAFDYQIIQDSSGTENDFRNIPEGRNFLRRLFD